jgi:hypothetical protein
MNDARKFCVISTGLSFAFGILLLIYFNYLEYQARQDLPPEMRTPEALQSYYDGSVCLGCDVAGISLLFLFCGLGSFFALICSHLGNL